MWALIGAVDSRRSVIAAPAGMVATSHPLAAQAGLRMLLQGGSAADAAVAATLTLCVVEPYSVSPGGDMWALTYDPGDGTVRALNGSGRAPAAATLGAYVAKGYGEAPLEGPMSVTVPGAVDGWLTLLQRHGRLPLAQVFAPAIAYADQGFPVSEVVARVWAGAARRVQVDPDAARVFLPAPAAGKTWRNPDLAATLRRVAGLGRDGFYAGPVAEAVMAKTGGWISESDLAAQRAEWAAPIATSYRGHQVFECPPNGQGVAALLALAKLDRQDIAALPLRSTAHQLALMEAVEHGIAVARRHVADPAFAEVPVADLLRAARGDTVYVAAVDAAGGAVSLISSIYQEFGSGLCAPATGVLLHDRGGGFSLDPASPNCVAPGKRPFHTIIPGLVCRDGALRWVFGVVGAAVQPQGHVQVLSAILDHGLGLQAALDLPRFRRQWSGETWYEAPATEDEVAALERSGRPVVVRPRWNTAFGIGQIIEVAPGVRLGASDPRGDGCAIGF
jgi:gamma-glutamyltranspeptidase/glutathione hydrolase